jgi:type I restriction enzyme S subunit
MTNDNKSTTKPFYNTTIPSDWEVKKLGEFAKVTSGGTPSREKNTYWGGSIPWITTSLINFNEIDSAEEFITENGLKVSSTKLFPSGTLLMALYGQGVTRGKTAILKMEAATNQACAAIILDEKRANRYFIFQYLMSKYEDIRKLSNTGNQENLNGELVKSLKVILPPLTEQNSIAHLLGLMDSAINQNNQLIANKELRKKWLMQNLLTGKKRLKGFDWEWKEIHIRDVSEEVSIRNKTDKQLTVLSCTKYDGLVQSLEYWGRKIFADDISTYKIVPKNHFAYATNHVEEGSIGYQDSFDEALISPMYTVFKTDSLINDLYFFKLLKSHKLIYQYQNRMEGSIDRRGGLRWDAFSIIKIHIPSYAEQTAIAQVLQAADKEIQLLKAKTEKLREQKKGMMQVLLTGRVRIKIKTI